MSKHGLRKGQNVRIGECRFLILQRLPDKVGWQLQNLDTGEYCKYPERELLELFADNKLTFVTEHDDRYPLTAKMGEKLLRDLSSYKESVIKVAEQRLEYLKGVDRLQPMTMTLKALQPVIDSVASRTADSHPPSATTVFRDYSKWIGSGRDIRAIIPRYSDRKPKIVWSADDPGITTQVIKELYLSDARHTVPDVHREIIRRVAEENKFRKEGDKLVAPSERSLYRLIGTIPAYDVMRARNGKEMADIEFRVSMRAPVTSRILERVELDHTTADMIVVDDQTFLPLGRPTFTTALDVFSRCPLGIYIGFEPPSFLAVARSLKHAILPKCNLSSEFPDIRHSWDCYGIPEILVVDNGREFHSVHLERACLQLGCDIQYAKPHVPWYKAEIERFLGTTSRELLHHQPGTTFSSTIDRGDYDPIKMAVIRLSTLREVVFKWIVDFYMYKPNEGINDIPAHKWEVGASELPPPLPPTAAELDIVLGKSARRTVFHYGIELDGIHYNSERLGELRRRLGNSIAVELTVDPGDLGQIYVLDPQQETYFMVPAVDQEYAKGLSAFQHHVIKRNARIELHGRTDQAALAQVKADIKERVRKDIERTPKRTHKRHGRMLEQHGTSAPQASTSVSTTTSDTQITTVPRRDFFDDVDENDLPVVEADLELPALTTARKEQEPTHEKEQTLSDEHREGAEELEPTAA